MGDMYKKMRKRRTERSKEAQIHHRKPMKLLYVRQLAHRLKGDRETERQFKRRYACILDIVLPSANNNANPNTHQTGRGPIAASLLFLYTYTHWQWIWRRNAAQRTRHRWWCRAGARTLKHTRCWSEQVWTNSLTLNFRIVHIGWFYL